MRIWILRLLTLAGLAMSIYLIHQHIVFQSGADVEKQGLCSVVKASRCAVTEGSKYSSVGPVPTAGLGGMFFFGFFVFSVLLWPRKDVPSAAPKPESIADVSPTDDVPTPNEPDASMDVSIEAPAEPPVLIPGPEPVRDPAALADFWSAAATFAVAGFIVSLTFGMLSLVVLKAFCIGCAIVYGISLAALVTVFQDWPWTFVKRAVFGPVAGVRLLAKAWRARGGTQDSLRRMALLLAILLVVPVFTGVPILLTRKAQAALAGKVLDSYLQQPKRAFRMRPRVLVKGEADAPLQLVIFADFQCPSCRLMATELKKMLSLYPDSHYRIVYKHFPLDPKCNPMVEKLLTDKKLSFEHDRACELAALGQGLGRYGKFWELYLSLYELQNWADMYPPLKSMSEKAGLDYAEWVAATKGTDNLREVVLDVGEALELGINAVPTIFINGRMAPSVRPQDLAFLLRVAPDYNNYEATATPAASPTPTPTPTK